MTRANIVRNIINDDGYYYTKHSVLEIVNVIFDEHEAQLKALQSKIDTAVKEIELWQPKEGEWVIPNFEKDENSITAYKVKEVISYKNPKTNIVVCYNNVALKLSQVSPFYFNNKREIHQASC